MPDTGYVLSILTISSSVVTERLHRDTTVETLLRWSTRIAAVGEDKQNYCPHRFPVPLGEITPVVSGGFLILGGTLCMNERPIIDGIDRWLNSTGTTQRPSDFEMGETSALAGRVLGSI